MFDELVGVFNDIVFLWPQKKKNKITETHNDRQNSNQTKLEQDRSMNQLDRHKISHRNKLKPHQKTKLKVTQYLQSHHNPQNQPKFKLGK